MRLRSKTDGQLSALGRGVRDLGAPFRATTFVATVDFRFAIAFPPVLDGSETKNPRASSVRGLVMLDEVEPVVFVVGVVDDVEERLLKPPRYWSRLPLSDHDLVDGSDWGNLRRRAREEHLVCNI